ncbi:MAG: hypothetical protein ACLQVA_08175 [Candidatus Brocadiia bacterium]
MAHGDSGLWSLDEKKIGAIPRRRQKQFQIWKSRVNPAQYQAVVAAINDHCDTHPVFTSSFIPGSDWTDTVYEPLYEACQGDQEHAGWFFGLIVWETMIRRPEKWYFKPAEKDSEDVLGMTYFKKT